jgi:hypothetical protein
MKSFKLDTDKVTPFIDKDDKDKDQTDDNNGPFTFRTLN